MSRGHISHRLTAGGLEFFNSFLFFGDEEVKSVNSRLNCLFFLVMGLLDLHMHLNDVVEESINDFELFIYTRLERNHVLKFCRIFVTRVGSLVDRLSNVIQGLYKSIVGFW